jgi:hypothetical protein
MLATALVELICMKRKSTFLIHNFFLFSKEEMLKGLHPLLYQRIKLQEQLPAVLAK